MEPLLLLWLLLWPLSSLRGWPRNVAKIPGKEGAEGGRREAGTWGTISEQKIERGLSGPRATQPWNLQYKKSSVKILSTEIYPAQPES